MEKYSLEEVAAFLEFMKYREGKASAEMASKPTPKTKTVTRPRVKPQEATHDSWTDDYGTKYWVHRWKPDCAEFGCAIHAPSQHHMRNWPRLMRSSTLIERHCTHDVGHPDPDSLRYFESVGQGHMSVHGCDGCCVPREDPFNRYMAAIGKEQECPHGYVSDYDCDRCNPYGYGLEDIH